MNFYHILYNPYASSGKGEEKAKELSRMLEKSSITYHDMTKIEDLQGFINSLRSVYKELHADRETGC